VSTGRIEQLTTVVRIANHTPKPEPDDDIRRVMLGMLAVLKRKFPEDWRKIVRELNEAKAA
jgi:hypothetical protein